MKLIKKCFIQYVPASLQQPLKRLLLWPLQRLINSSRDMWLPIYRIDQSGLTVVLIGHEAHDPYLIYLLYAEYLKPIRIGIVPIWSLNRAIRTWEDKTDLIIFRDRKFRPEKPVARRMLSIPYYVSQLIDLPLSDVDLRTAFYNSKARGDLKKIGKADFQYEITQDPAQLDFFYHQMYRPTIQKRHSDAAKILSWEDFSQAYGEMDLLLIRKAGLPVAGCLNLQTGDCYTGHMLGVLNGDRELYRAGGIAACYWFSIVEAHRRGCATLNPQCARPFLKNGVMAYKKKWGGRIVMDHRERELWLLPCGNGTLHRFLEENPFICEQDGRLVSLIFLGSHTILNDKELFSYLKECHYQHGDRLSTCVVLLNNEWAARAQTIQKMLHELPQPNRLVDLSQGSLAELPELISNWQDLFHDLPAEFAELAYSR